MFKSNPFKWRHNPAPKSYLVAFGGILVIRTLYRQVAERKNWGWAATSAFQEDGERTGMGYAPRNDI